MHLTQTFDCCSIRVKTLEIVGIIYIKHNFMWKCVVKNQINPSVPISVPLCNFLSFGVRIILRPSADVGPKLKFFGVVTWKPLEGFGVTVLGGGSGVPWKPPWKPPWPWFVEKVLFGRSSDGCWFLNCWRVVDWKLVNGFRELWRFRGASCLLGNDLTGGCWELKSGVCCWTVLLNSDFKLLAGLSEEKSLAGKVCAGNLDWTGGCCNRTSWKECCSKYDIGVLRALLIFFGTFLCSFHLQTKFAILLSELRGRYGFGHK